MVNGSSIFFTTFQHPNIQPLNLSEYNLLLNKPETVNEQQTDALEKIVQEFPYFQSARALHLKGLYNQDSFQYNNALKITAAHTTDRSVLFNFITSDTFTAIHKGLYEQKLAEIYNIVVRESELVATEITPEMDNAKIEASILTSIRSSEIPYDQTMEIESAKSIDEINTSDEGEKTIVAIAAEATAEKLDIGKPLEFSQNETHSFREWLQLSSLKPIAREPESQDVESRVEVARQKKKTIIDQFIKLNPKIPPIRQESSSPSVNEAFKDDNSALMTETLARVYLEQKKYQKAIQAYEILIMKYPEKITFFADRISEIKNLQKNT